MEKMSTLPSDETNSNDHKEGLSLLMKLTKTLETRSGPMLVKSREFLGCWWTWSRFQRRPGGTD